MHERERQALASGPSLLATGFRPFFLLGALLAVVWVALWTGSLMGYWQVGGRLGALTWHSHEMLFGFTAAIFAGFLLTAVVRWTGLPTVGPRGLLALVSLWLLGRVAVLWSQGLPLALVACLDVLFLPALAYAIWWPLWRARSWRNLGFVPLLLVMAVANGLLYLQALGVVGAWASRSTSLMFHLSLLLVAIVGGRIAPLFTQNKLRAMGRDVAVIKQLWLGRLGGAILAVGAAALMLGWSTLGWGAMIGAGVCFAIRLAGWRTLHVLDIPMLWVLHLGYGCLALGLIWYGFEGIYAMGHTTAALHLLALGCIGVMCLGMMSRVALGHTGRTIEASPMTTVAYFLLLGAAAARVIPGVWFPGWYMKGLLAAGLLWCIAFALYLFGYWRILCSPRADGKPG